MTTVRRPRRRRWLFWGSTLVIVMAVGLGAVFGARLNQDPTLVDTPLIGEPVPSRTLPYLERDKSVSLSDLRGQIVVVNFWASWCVACREEHSALVAAAAAYRDAGVKFVGVVYQDTKPNAVSFLDELGRGEGYLYLTDPGSRLAIDFGVFGIPETFFIDKKGRIAAKITGGSTLPLLSGVLDKMLVGGTPDPSVTTAPVQEGPGE
ncbi:redoxin [Tersicoccus phoenicis]|uniref:Redoxin n=2 Tax=Tersicoccus phoenicis TaxID=554083 RepID=A0A1R1L8H0_9MICC|nr:redoxin [Tersicoccus phoenicis]